MENTRLDVAGFAINPADVAEVDVHELNDLQLTLVGGGIGDPVAA